MEEARGLKKLKKKVKEGELVIVKSDKSGKFSVMSMNEYRRAGEDHTRKDREVTVDFLLNNQRKLNGHIYEEQRPQTNTHVENISYKAVPP
jgi:hypothetical protein